MEQIKHLDEAKMYYLDESGIDDNEVPLHGWSKKGVRLYGEKNGYRKKRLSIIACKNGKKIVAPFYFEGACNREIIQVYLEKVLAKHLKKGDILIMDNASFHKGGNIKSFLNKIGVILIYLPPYSPDFNPIEKSWSSIKNTIRKFIQKCNNNLYQAAQKAFSSILRVAV